MPPKPVNILRVPIAFNTPGLVLSGIPVYTPKIGDLVWPGVSLWTPWDGAGTPQFYVHSQGAAYASDNILNSGLVPADVDYAQGANWALLTGASPVAISGAYRAVTATPLRVVVDDGTGGDPGATQGAGEIVLIVAAA